MSSDKDTIMKGIRYLAFSFPLLFGGPTLFAAMYAKDLPFWTYFSIGIMLLAVFLAVKGIRLVLKGFFNTKE
ncbi:MAG: hypothetical protein SchgKO_04350 [Schleiferiaceae bacterium]